MFDPQNVPQLLPNYTASHPRLFLFFCVVLLRHLILFIRLLSPFSYSTPDLPHFLLFPCCFYFFYISFFLFSFCFLHFFLFPLPSECWPVQLRARRLKGFGEFPNSLLSLKLRALACHLLASFLNLFLRPWRWRRYVPPKRRLKLNGLGMMAEDPLGKVLTWNSNFKFCKPPEHSVIATGYGLDCQNSIPGMGKRLLYISQRPCRFWGPPSLLSNGYGGFFSGDKAAGEWSWSLDLQLVSGPRIVELYLNSPICLHGIVLN
jgi:hypothetical protein